MSYGSKAFGLREVVLEDVGGGNEVELPVAQTLMFSERVVSGELAGGDAVAALVSYPDALEWSLEAGGIPLAAWAKMTGRTAVESGTTPNRTTTYTAKAAHCYPYFQAKGRAISDDCDSDAVVTLLKIKLTEAPNGQFQNGEFFVTAAAGTGMKNDDGDLYTLELRETGASIVS